ncbi:MAG: hypothetical protein M0D57_21700 [Sphingobacteriales bacterium JAD_PAG50586_3]|nr:MAG: hypothetical protein M0D57_21700 [Sphingobacteriales bacterium JAD_PAG50586_3]
MESIINAEMFWEFSKEKTSLISNNQVIVELKDEKTSKASFDFGGESYVIKNIGFWKAKTIIESGGKIILSLSSSFLGSKGTIEFANGAKYQCKVHNSPLVKLSFYTTEGQEILSYRLDTSLKPQTVMEILPHAVTDNDLLMLIILGCFAFKGITIENTEADFITLVAGA